MAHRHYEVRLADGSVRWFKVGGKPSPEVRYAEMTSCGHSGFLAQGMRGALYLLMTPLPSRNVRLSDRRSYRAENMIGALWALRLISRADREASLNAIKRAAEARDRSDRASMLRDHAQHLGLKLTARQERQIEKAHSAWYLLR